MFTRILNMLVFLTAILASNGQSSAPTSSPAVDIFTFSPTVSSSDSPTSSPTGSTNRGIEIPELTQEPVDQISSSSRRCSTWWK